MQKINKLTYKLEQLQSQKSNLGSLDDISIFQFIKYKNILTKTSKITQKIQKKIELGNEINFWYDTNTKSWIENPKINCKKYYRLEKNAFYKRNLKLYHLGLLDKRPLKSYEQKIIKIFKSISNHIILFHKNFKNKLKSIDYSKFNVFNKLQKKYNIFISNILPQKLNRLAVDAATIGIKGYRRYKSECKFIRNSITSKKSFNYIKNVINEANMRVDIAEKEKSFRESLKVDPNSFNNNILNSNKLIDYPKSKNSIEKPFEYSL